MPEFRLIDNRRREADVIREMTQKVEGFNEILLKKLAAEIVRLSPVDTGTYMESHSISSRRTGAPAKNSSHGKPRNQEKDPFAQAALDRLFSEIEALKPGDNAFVANTAVHAKIVEYGGANWQRGPYAVYRSARAKTPVFVQEAAAEVTR